MSASSPSEFEQELERFCDRVSAQLTQSDLVPHDIAPSLWQARILVSGALDELRVRNRAHELASDSGDDRTPGAFRFRARPR